MNLLHFGLGLFQGFDQLFDLSLIKRDVHAAIEGVDGQQDLVLQQGHEDVLLSVFDFDLHRVMVHDFSSV